MGRYLPGDIVSRRKGLFRHQGIALDGDRVLHNTPGRGEHISSLQTFSDGRQVRVHPRTLDDRRRALYSALGSSGRRYDLLTNNCEHTVSRIGSGRARSPQLAGWLLGAAVGGAALLLSRHPAAGAAGFALGQHWARQTRAPVPGALPLPLRHRYRHW